MDLTPIESSLLCFERKASKHIYLLMSFLSLIYFLKDILNRYRANLARLYAEVCGGWWPGPILWLGPGAGSRHPQSSLSSVQRRRLVRGHGDTELHIVMLGQSWLWPVQCPCCSISIYSSVGQHDQSAVMSDFYSRCIHYRQ